MGVPHASLTLTLQVTEATGGFSLLYSKHPAGGTFQLYLDDGLYWNFDGYAETPLYTREISHITLPAGVYTLTLVNGEGVFWFEAIQLLHGTLSSAPELGLLLQDDFDDGNFHLWREGHELEFSPVATGSGQAVQFSPGMTMHLWHGGHRNLALVVDVLMQSGQADLILRTSASGQYELSLTKSGTLSLYHNLSLLDSAEIGVIPDGTWHRLRFEAIEGNLTVSVDGVPVIETVDPDPLPAGTIALSAGSAPDNSFQVDNVEVWIPIDALPAPVQQTIPSPTPLEMTALQTAQTGELVYMCRAYVPGIGFRWTSICTKPLEATDGVYFRESNSQLTRYGSPDWSPGGDMIGYSYHWIMTLDSPMWIEAYQRDNTLMSYFRNYETLINQSAVWSPDGSRMVYVALADEYPTPYGWTADSNALYTVPFPCRGCRLSTPLTPDGQWIAFGSNRSGDWGIWKISAAGGTPTLITRGEYPVWSPVANQIAFAKPNALGTRSIYVIDLDTDEVYQVTAASAAYNMIPSDWSPDGSQILFYQVNTTGNVFYTMHYTDGHQFNQPMTDVGIGLGGKWYGDPCLTQTAAQGMTALDDACQPEPVCTLADASPGLAEEAQAMQAVVDMEAGQPVIHAGPTFNAKHLTTLPWGTEFSPDFRYELYSDADELRQVWFSPTDSDGWILGWMKANNGEEFEYVMDYTNCVAPEPSTFTFYYNREMAVRFAIAQAYENNENSNIPERHKVTSNPGGNFPYYNFVYPQQIDNSNQSIERTGSAIFVSENIWMGGLPTTISLDNQFNPTECIQNGTDNTIGWRYCLTEQIASEAWRSHLMLIGYYIQGWDAGGVKLPKQVRLFPQKDSTGQVNDPDCPNGDITAPTCPGFLSRKSIILLPEGDTYPYENQGNLIFNTDPDAPVVQTLWQYNWFFTPDNLSSFINLPTGQLIDPAFSATDLYLWIQTTQLVNIRYGDYVFINSKRPGRPNVTAADDHGFLVAGWGPILSCSDALDERKFVLSMEQSGQENERDTTIFPDIITAYDNSVPYVVDFSGANLGSRRQTPVPRPFYCSRFQDDRSATKEDDFFSDGHSWFFFTMPDDMELPWVRLYGLP